MITLHHLLRLASISTLHWLNLAFRHNSQHHVIIRPRSNPQTYVLEKSPWISCLCAVGTASGRLISEMIIIKPFRHSIIQEVLSRGVKVPDMYWEKKNGELASGDDISVVVADISKVMSFISNPDWSNYLVTHSCDNVAIEIEILQLSISFRQLFVAWIIKVLKICSD